VIKHLLISGEIVHKTQICNSQTYSVSLKSAVGCRPKPPSIPLA